jgi:hypothetical protein
MAKQANLDVSESLDITIKRGDSFEMGINIKDNGGVNLPLLTNDYSFVIQIKTPLVSSSASRRQKSKVQSSQRSLIAASSLEESKTQDTPSDKDAESPIFTFEDKDDNGNVSLRATAQSTASLPVGSFVYDLQYKFTKNGFENVKTLLKGNFIVNEDISTPV